LQNSDRRKGKENEGNVLGKNEKEMEEERKVGRELLRLRSIGVLGLVSVPTY
jgi:hypothetical protein